MVLILVGNLEHIAHVFRLKQEGVSISNNESGAEETRGRRTFQVTNAYFLHKI